MFDVNWGLIVDHLHDGVYVTDRQRRIAYWNAAAERISGFPAAEVIGRHCHDRILTHVDREGRDLCRGLCPLAQALRDGQPREDEIFLHHRDGHRVPVRVRIVPLRDAAGETIGAAEIFRDIGDEQAIRQRMEELEKIAMLDSLTRLATRRYLETEIDSQLAEQRRYGTSFGVFMVDLDRFKTVNDRYGHGVGDQVLRTIATTLRRNARPFDVFGRWGGDELLALIRNVGSDGLSEVVARSRWLVEKSYVTVGDDWVNVTVSIGATVARSGDTVESIVARADRLLYEAKAQGRGRWVLG